ncbi:MAG: hypothetical protein CMK29_06670 [Porticoccaceae bacterium]|nr:hypothetical protein [Porticoccaceae bacterium]
MVATSDDSGAAEKVVRVPASLGATEPVKLAKRQRRTVVERCLKGQRKRMLNYLTPSKSRYLI